MAIKALITYAFSKERINELSSLGYDLVLKCDGHCADADFLDAEVVVGYNPFKDIDITTLKNLKWIQATSAGVDHFPLDYIIKNNITVSNNKGYSIPIGEWIVMDILQLLKKSFKLFNQQKNRKWKMENGILELYGRTVGFVGTGSIAKEAAKRLKCFEPKILGINTKGSPVEYFDKCYGVERIDEMLGISDIVVLTIPYTKAVDKLINADRIAKMKDGAFFINISRGNIVDEKALIEALKRRKIAGAALDVFENEPLSPQSPLWDMDNVIITPHNSFHSDRREDRIFEIVYKNMKNYIEGKQIENIVNLERGY